MLQFLADENFNNDIVRGLFRRDATIDIVRVQDVGLQGADDAAVIQWAAIHNRILLTHDRTTIPEFVYSRIINSIETAGVFIIPIRLSLRSVIEDILLINGSSYQAEWQGLILYFPL